MYGFHFGDCMECFSLDTRYFYTQCCFATIMRDAYSYPSDPNAFVERTFFSRPRVDRNTRIYHIRHVQKNRNVTNLSAKFERCVSNRR